MPGNKIGHMRMLKRSSIFGTLPVEWSLKKQCREELSLILSKDFTRANGYQLVEINATRSVVFMIFVHVF